MPKTFAQFYMSLCCYAVSLRCVAEMPFMVSCLWFSDDSDDGSGEGPSLAPSNPHAPVLAGKEEPLDSEEGTKGSCAGGGTESGTLNGALLQGTEHNLQLLTETYSVIHFLVMNEFWFHNVTLFFTEHKADKANLYNFSKLRKSRKWLKVFCTACWVLIIKAIVCRKIFSVFTTFSPFPWKMRGFCSL